MATEKMIKTTDVYLVKSIDQVKQFEDGMKAFNNVIGVLDVVKLREGMTINRYKASVDLADGTVAEGETIPLSQVKLEKDTPIVATLKKYRKATTGEAIQRSGKSKAVTETDRKLVAQLRNNLRKSIFTSLADGAGTTTGAGLQKALANALAKVQIAFDGEEEKVIAFIHPEDLADYQGRHAVTLESQFGLKYLQNFLGFDVVIIDANVPKGTAYATASNNLKLYVIDPADSELAEAFGLTADETGFIGMTHFVGHDNLTVQTLLVSGAVYVAEVTAGVIKATITPIV